MMCKECGCGQTGGAVNHHRNEGGHSTREAAQEHAHERPHYHVHTQGGEPHMHVHAHDHEHTAGPGLEHSTEVEVASRRTIQVRQSMLDKNDRLAERNRGFFLARDLLAVNVLSSPGSGKTTFLGETLKRLGAGSRGGVIVGDLATDNDAVRLRETGAPVAQITTGTMCHLEAEMIGEALKRMELSGLGFLFIENVGNLVCPAAYDLGERLRVVLFSVTEGEDKPLKYPPVFQSADAVVISKMDLAGPCEFDRECALANLRKAAPRARVFELSSRSGAGFESWMDYLRDSRRELREQPQG